MKKRDQFKKKIKQCVEEYEEIMQKTLPLPH